jgi:hypothetical protein
MMMKLKQMTDSMQHNLVDLKEKFKAAYGDHLPTMNITHMDFDFKSLFDELNEKIHNFKENILEKVIKLYNLCNFSWTPKKWNGLTCMTCIIPKLKSQKNQ